MYMFVIAVILVLCHSELAEEYNWFTYTPAYRQAGFISFRVTRYSE
jgi:hypothetical protein